MSMQPDNIFKRWDPSQKIYIKADQNRYFLLKDETKTVCKYDTSNNTIGIFDENANLIQYFSNNYNNGSYFHWFIVYKYYKRSMGLIDK